ncbi:outer membrane beta-barrel protein [uncultured Mucilaginibacter sp.]|uniref:outer membrane beta-barrel protein n=1 Tax=uncultured Mucilaginibacter sp. TaxID=797541 RepID=UPI0025E45B65|nr:outer membrane beta-barrel protein [uncultured Mucilaginibacter sp.]
MKNLVFMLFLSAWVGVSQAQSLSFEVRAGVDGVNMSSNNNGLYQAKNLSWQTQLVHNLTGYHAGAFADIKWGWFTLQPGVNVTVKGGKNEIYYVNISSANPYSYHGTEELTVDYLEVPLNFLVNIPIHGEGKIFFGGGPYVDFGLAATDNNTLDQTNLTYSTETHNNLSPQFGTELKNPSYGFNTLGGITFNYGFQLSVGYGVALTNLSTNNSTDAKLRSFSISMGYCF